jgi:hypothetical protein
MAGTASAAEVTPASCEQAKDESKWTRVHIFRGLYAHGGLLPVQYTLWLGVRFVCRNACYTARKDSDEAKEQGKGQE